MVSTWSVQDKILAAVAAVVLVVIVALGVMALRSGDDDAAIPPGCEGATLESDLESDQSPTDVLRQFVQERAPEFPSGDWVTQSVDGDRFTFASFDGGRFEIEVENGLVRRYLKCPAD